MPYTNPYQPYVGYPAQYPAWQPSQAPVATSQQTWLPQQQAAQQHVQQPQRLVGRTVASAQEVTPQEVPMDGSLALFPLADGSAVVGKRWTPEGTIAEVRYVPEASSQQPEAQTFEQAVMERLDSIEGMLSRPKRSARKPREEDDDAES